MHRKLWLTAVVVILTPWGWPSAGTIHVPADQPTIQAGIDAASEGDTVLLAPGVYSGPGNRDLNPGGKPVVIRSPAGRERPVIHCGGSEDEPHRAILVDPPLDAPLVLEGLIIRNGFFENGGAIYSKDSPVKIRNCAFRGNGARNGGALYLDHSSDPVVEDCEFESNWVWSDGAAIFSVREHGVIKRCLFVNNTGSVICGVLQSEISDCRFEGNKSKHGSVVSGHRHKITGCEFVNNEVDYNGAVCSGGDMTIDRSVFAWTRGRGAVIGIFGWWMRAAVGNIDHCTIYGNGRVFSLVAARPLISNTIIAFNRGNSFACSDDCYYDRLLNEVFCEYARPRLITCNLYGNDVDYEVDCIEHLSDANDNISVDPLFCDTVTLNLELYTTSPCLGAGESGSNMGALPVGCGPDPEDLYPEDPVFPISFSLSQNYPNPFNSGTTIDYTLPENTQVRLAIYNVLGRKVATLIDDKRSAGEHSASWNGTDSDGRSVSSGVYYYRIIAGEFTSTKKMIVLK